MSSKNQSYILNHLGEDRSNYKNAVTPPIFQSSNFTFSSFKELQNSIQDELNIPFYTRGCNPTVQILRKKIAALEHKEDALVFSSGSGAMAATVLSFCKAGDHVVCLENPYSWTNKLLQTHLQKFNVEVSFIQGEDGQAYESATRKNTVLYLLESPNSITFEIQDIQSIATVAKQRNIKTIIDNSYCTPLFQQPALLGIDLIIHSASKYLNGHSDIVAGVVCGNKRDIHAIFEGPYMTLGAAISPNDAWLMMRGLRTLPIRMKQVAETTKQVVAYLAQHPMIQTVHYPFLDTHPNVKIAKQQMKEAPGLCSIELKVSSPKEIEQFVDALQYFLLACSWGGYESLVFPIAALSQSENYDKVPYPWNLIRLYFGLESAAVLIQDLDQAFAAIQ